MTAVEPSDPWDAEGLAHEWEFEDRDEYVRRWILEAGGRRVGVAEIQHSHWERTPERYVYVNAYLWPGRGREGLLAGAFEGLEARARALVPDLSVTAVKVAAPPELPALEAEWLPRPFGGSIVASIDFH